MPRPRRTHGHELEAQLKTHRNAGKELLVAHYERKLEVQQELRKEAEAHHREEKEENSLLRDILWGYGHDAQEEIERFEALCDHAGGREKARDIMRRHNDNHGGYW